MIFEHGMKFFAFIPLTKGKFSLVDFDDAIKVNEHKWQMHNKGYACKGSQFLLHRFILNAKKGEEIDHVNLNKLDNRKSNLRIVSHRNNCQNRRAKGWILEKRTGKFYSQIKVGHKRIHLGTFETKDEAIEAYNNAKMKHFGKFAFMGG